MNNFWALTIFIILAVLSPGPDFIVVTKNSLNHSRISGIYTAIGVSCGAFLLALTSIFGLTVIIANSPTLFNVVKYVGAMYLVYLGIKAIISGVRHKAIINFGNIKHTKISNFLSLKQGFLCSVLNPKAILFFTALFTTIIQENTSIALQLGYGFEVSIIYLAWFVILAIIITHSSIRVTFDRIGHYINTILGTLLLLLGIHVLTIAHLT